MDLRDESPLCRLVQRHHADLARQPQYASRIEPLLTVDEGALRKTINYYMQHATVVEAMVVALQHMQISVCTMRGFSGKPGLACYRKTLSASHKSCWSSDNCTNSFRAWHPTMLSPSAFPNPTPK